MNLRQLLIRNGFMYQATTKDYTRQMSENVVMRCEIANQRIKVFLQFDKIEGFDEYWDIVYLNSYTPVSFEKLMYAFTVILKLN